MDVRSRSFYLLDPVCMDADRVMETIEKLSRKFNVRLTPKDRKAIIAKIACRHNFDCVIADKTVFLIENKC